MTTPLIISTYLEEDGRISGARSNPLSERANGMGLQSACLSIQPLSSGWSAEPPGTFKSGAGPIFAIAEAKRLLESGTDLIVISGKDLLRSGYSSADRARMMEVFPGTTLPEAYTELTREFMKLHGISEEFFLSLAKALENNCRRTALERGLKVDASGKNDQFVTSLFRLVDCANPVTDFEGEVVVATPDAARQLGFTGVQIAAVETLEVPDGPKNIKTLATYEHLKTVIEAISRKLQLGTGLAAGWQFTDIAMELYTCFPVVPLAYLWASGLATKPSEMLEFLQTTPITLSGGMNFARAPWNNPALRALILATRAVEAGAKIGLVHGNGGLGGRQGICVLGPKLAI